MYYLDISSIGNDYNNLWNWFATMPYMYICEYTLLIFIISAYLKVVRGFQVASIMSDSLWPHGL